MRSKTSFNERKIQNNRGRDTAQNSDQQGVENGAHGWVEKKVLENLDATCLDLFSSNLESDNYNIWFV